MRRSVLILTLILVLLLTTVLIACRRAEEATPTAESPPAPTATTASESKPEAELTAALCDPVERFRSAEHAVVEFFGGGLALALRAGVEHDVVGTEGGGGFACGN